MKILKSLAGRLQGDSFTRNVFLLFSGTAIGQAIPILLSPILTRLYMPDDFGALGVFSSICLTLVPLVTLRYELALLLVANEREAAELIVITAISILIVSFATFLVCLALPLYPIPALGPWQFGSFILPLAVLAIGAYQLLVYEGTRQANYDPIARTKLLQGLTGPLSQILFGLIGLGSAGLVYGFVIGQFSGTTYLFRRFMLPHRKNLPGTTLGSLARLALQYKKFPLYSSWSGVFSAAGSQYAVLILVAALYGPVIAGFIFLADRIVGRPLLLVTTSTLQVYSGEISKLVGATPGLIMRRFLKVIGLQALASVLWCSIVFLLAPRFVVPLFGAAWHDAVVYIQIMCAVYFVQSTMHPVHPTLQILQRQARQAAWETLRLVAVVAAIVGAANAGASATAALILYACAQAGSYLILLAIQLHSMREAGRLTPAPGAVAARRGLSSGSRLRRLRRRWRTGPSRRRCCGAAGAPSSRSSPRSTQRSGRCPRAGRPAAPRRGRARWRGCRPRG